MFGARKHKMAINNMVGQTIRAIGGGSVGDDEMVFIAESGARFKFWHNQDCCENVRIEDVCGDLNDLIGSPLISASEIDGGTEDSSIDSSTWTFYVFGTAKGTVTVRWLGESNGYYSERVDYYEDWSCFSKDLNLEN
jgi:hypothetical protein